jgi:hypothetical protein
MSAGEPARLIERLREYGEQQAAAAKAGAA